MLRTRPLALAGRARDALRPGRGRRTTAVALGAAGTLVAGIVVAGVGAAGGNPDLSDIGAWLSSDSKNSIAHVNGLTGQVDGRIKLELPSGDKSQLQVSEDGNSVLVLDETTGRVSRIDVAQLTVPQVHDYASAGLALASGGGKAWLVDAGNGTVRPIDPVTLAPLSDPLDLGGKPLGTAVADTTGTLWVPVPSTGELVAVPGDKIGARVNVAEPGAPLWLTLASGRPVVTDVRGGNVVVVSASGIERTIKLPEETKLGAPEKVLVTESSEGPVVPILAADTGTLTLANIDTGSITAVPLAIPNHEFGPPQVLGVRVYVPDRTSGVLLVYNTAKSGFEDQVKITGAAGPLETYVQDGLLWVNDPSSSAAAVVNVQGQVQMISKYENSPGPGPGSATSSANPTPAKSVPEGGYTASSAPVSSPAPSATGASTPPPGSDQPTTPGNGGTTSAAPPASVPAPPTGTVPGGGGDNPAPTRTQPPDDPTPTKTTTRPGRPTIGVPTIPDPPTTPAPTTQAPTTAAPTTQAPTTQAPTTQAPTTQAPTTQAPTTQAPTTPPTTPPTTKTSSPPTSSPNPTTTSPKPPEMQAPGTPQVKSDAGRITVTFQPPADAKPLRYRLVGHGADQGVSPLVAPANGPFKFTVTGGSCDREYKFYVTAEYPNGAMNSKSSVPVRPCVVPGKPTGLAAKAAAGGKANLSWKAPAKATGGKISYTASWKRGTKSGKTDTAGTSASFDVDGVAGTYNFQVVAKNGAGSNSASTATLKTALKWSSGQAAAPGPPYAPEDPFPSGPGDGTGAVAHAAAIAPNRRPAPVSTM